MLKSLSIRLKLVLLAGVPVLGAMALASLLWTQAQKSAKSAEALGSVEDLAKLSTGISALVHELQTESAWVGVYLGHLDRIAEELDPDVAAEAKKASLTTRTTLKSHYARTDAAKANLDQFLSSRDLTALPKRLQRDLKLAKDQLSRLPALRADESGEKFSVTESIEFFAVANSALIDATASLTNLSDDGELLRNISALVSVMQVKERAGQEQALLGAVFSANRYPPGTYRSFVTLTTQEQVYIDVLRANANDAQIQSYDESMKKTQVVAALAMRKKALETIDEDLEVTVEQWFTAQNAKMMALKALESRLTGEVRGAALAKVHETESSIQTSLGLSAAVLLVSTLLGWLIARGVDTSVRALSDATSKVQTDKDFSIRAVKVSDDELGLLTDGFNAMLTDIQKRDVELEEYRHGLEEKVEERTAALSARNESMRMVLDNVEQGLATIRQDGTLDSERSAIFDAWFGAPANDTGFGVHLTGGDADLAAMMTIGWDEVQEGFLPPELTIEQMPSTLQVGDKHYTLAYKPTIEDEEVLSALLVVTDVTEEVARRAEEVKQREFIAIFERVMKDKNGFVEFFNETEKLVVSVFEREADRKLMMRDVHTIKGNCGIYGVSSVSTACHDLETAVAEDDCYPTEQHVQILRSAWEPFAARVRTLVGEESEDVVEVAHGDLEALIASVRRRLPHGEIATQLQRLKYEPIASRFERIGEQAVNLAAKLGKPTPKLVLEPHDLRFPAERWAGFWGAFSHVLRNAVDHGLETAEQRQQRGKEGPGMLRLAAVRGPGGYIIELQDDGNGVNWEAVRRKARNTGLPVATHQDLVAALFSDGVSTRDVVSDTSGRGVGMGAVMQATVEMKGSIDIESELGVGTTFRFKFPVAVGDLIGFRSRAPGARPSLNPPPLSKVLSKPA